MHAVRQSVRPKHQVLILKCYPRFQKGVADVKPNPSELSYLLYYATTRRSKVQKVGAFLEKKSGSDVSHGRLGNVQVTLQIIRALIDKSPRDLPLYAPYVLRILQIILLSKNLPMVEDSVPTFQAFCEHHDAALVTADQDVTKDFEKLVREYGSFVDSPPAQSRAPPSRSTALKWKIAGLQAVKSITSSEAIAMNPRQYLNIIMPVILNVLHSESAEDLLALKQKVGQEKEIARRRRMSTATAQTTDSLPEDHAISASAADADRQAEEEAAIIALQSLEQVFASSNPLQIRWGTFFILNFLAERPLVSRPETARTTSTNQTSRATNKITVLADIIANWTPVQARFIIMVTAMELLVECPIKEDSMEKQLVFVIFIEYLLGSTINMIGLTVIDVLQGLIQHILMILQLGGQGTNVLPHHQPTDTIDLFQETKARNRDSNVIEVNSDTQHVQSPSANRQQLLTRLRSSVGNLATHIYYSEQVRDITREILNRLKPLNNSSTAGAAAAIERPDEAALTIAQSINMNDDPETDKFFSFGTARVTALNAIRDVLIIANNKGVVTGAGAIGRSRVSVQQWEGTQWLLRDEDRRVRQAYIEALLTWLRLELSKQDQRVLEESPKSKKDKSANDTKNGKEVMRSVSNASPSSKTRLSKSTFLQLLHLAIYDNTIEGSTDESNILLMHLLLVSLVQKLGVNASKTGLPMITRLQQDTDTLLMLQTTKARINVASLIHGYLWALSDVFDIDTTAVGFEVQSEISRRQELGLWLDAIRVPPRPLELIVAAGSTASLSKLPRSTNGETLKHFDHIPELVRQIAVAYASKVSSPPVSPPVSPGRVFTMPLALASGHARSSDVLPAEFKEDMLASWSKEACIASAMKARTASPHGSRSGTTRSAPNGLLSAEGYTPRDSSPAGLQAHSRTRGRIPSAFMPLQTGQLKQATTGDSGPATPVSNGSEHTGTLRLDDLKRVLAGGALADAFSTQGRSSVRTSSPLRNSQTAAQDFAEGERLGRAITRPRIISTGSESVVDAEGFESASEGDIDHPLPSPQTPADATEIAQHNASDKAKDQHPPATPTSPSRRSMGRPRSASETSTEDPEANVRALRGGLPSDVVRGSIVGDNGVPPVPPLPEGLIRRNNLAMLNGNNAVSSASSAVPPNTALVIPEAREKSTVRDGVATENRPKSMANTESVAPGSFKGSTRGSVHGSVGRRSLRSAGPDKKNMVQALLGSIEVGNAGGQGIGKPPY